MIRSFAEKKVAWYSQSSTKKKTNNEEYLGKFSFRVGEIVYPEKQKLKEFITTKPALQEMFKENV